MTLYSAFMCWLIFNELFALANTARSLVAWFEVNSVLIRWNRIAPQGIGWYHRPLLVVIGD
jgi:hypothetical protein